MERDTFAPREIIREARDEYMSQDRRPASTLVAVTGLAEKDFLIEIEMVAPTER